jgi:Protein of unknown function (DUF2569)
MPIRVKCLKTYNVPDSFAGKKATCSSCGSQFRIMVEAQAPPPSALPPSHKPSIAVDTQEPQPSGIEGWLIIPAIGLVLSPIKRIAAFFWGIFLIQEYAPEIMGDPRWLLTAFIDVAMIVACVIVAFLFFNRRRITVGAIIGLMSASIIASVIQAVLNMAMFEDIGTDAINPVIHACVFAAIWIPYFLRSKRVKNTFTV